MNCKIISLTNKIWNIQQESISEDTDIMCVLAENRGISDLDSFMNISIKNSMPDPFVFIDMEKAVNRIVKAIKDKQKIAILGDYDVDGVSSVSILIKFLDHMGADYTYIIPNRVDEGYGLNISNISKHKECLIIAVDCGSSSVDELQYAKDNGIDVIILDHHRISSTILEESGAIIVNPHRPDESGKYTYLCSAGLVFIFVVGINRLLKETNYIQDQEINLLDYLDLVALATVCDVVELVELNRAFVSTGIKIIQQRRNLGIEALLSTYKGNDITSETIAFFLGPKLNAAGRLASADLSVRLLVTESWDEANKIAMQLDSLNKGRQVQEQKIMAEALPFVKEDKQFICAYDSNWHVGIIGIIAGRLKEKYHKPSIVISCDSKGIGKASCRSINGVDISEVIRNGIEQGVIISGGGHYMAGGFSVDMSKINDLLEFLSSAIQYESHMPELYADCVIPLDKISINFVKKMSALEPFGEGNRIPKFVIRHVNIRGARIVGENHISFYLQDEYGNSMKAISFRSVNTILGEILLDETNDINVLGTLGISLRNNKKYVNFLLEDISQS